MAECLNPFYKKDTGEQFPCGKCFNCLQRRASGWSFRLMIEDKYAKSGYFVTLTYDNDNIPLTAKGYMTLDRPGKKPGQKYADLSHIQKFMRRIRFAQFGRSKGDLKYYMCGEYGGISYRPHYHVIFFNLDVKYLIGSRDAKFTQMRFLELDGKVPYECPSWEYGHITVGCVNQASVGYVLKYMSKPKRIPFHENDDRVKEYSTMSKGIGLAYLTPGAVKWHRSDLNSRMYLNVADGIKTAMPRYYKLKLYSDQDRRDICRFLETTRKPKQPLRECDRIFINQEKLKRASQNRKN